MFTTVAYVLACLHLLFGTDEVGVNISLYLVIKYSTNSSDVLMLQLNRKSGNHHSSSRVPESMLHETVRVLTAAIFIIKSAAVSESVFLWFMINLGNCLLSEPTPSNKPSCISSQLCSFFFFFLLHKATSSLVILFNNHEKQK